MGKKRTDRAVATPPPEKFQRLRGMAEELLEKGRAAPRRSSDHEAAALIHELSVQRVELELQNEELERANRETEQARQKYYDLYDRAPVAYLSLDKRGTLVEMNLTAAQLLGKPRSALKGAHLLRFVPPADQPALDAFLRQVFASRLKHSCEVSLLRGAAPSAAVRLEGFLADPEAGEPPLCRAVLVDITERRRGEEALRRSEEATRRANEGLERTVAERTDELRRLVDTLQEEVRARIRTEADLARALEQLKGRASQLRALASRLTQAEHRERLRVATILHDDLQQILAAAKFQAALLGRSEREETRQSAAAVVALLETSLATCRSLTTELCPPVLQLGGVGAAIEWLARSMAERYGLRVDVTLEGEIPLLADETKIPLFETVRELLFNVVKHARADAAAVRLRCATAGGVEVVISDTGRGFDPEGLSPGGREGGASGSSRSASGSL